MLREAQRRVTEALKAATQAKKQSDEDAEDEEQDDEEEEEEAKAADKRVEPVDLDALKALVLRPAAEA